MSDTGIWDLFAIRYGRHAGRVRADNFIMPPDRHDAPMPIDYFVWAIVDGERAIVVDTGFDRAEAARRGREIQRLPREGLAMLGIDSRAVEDVIVTHLHYDHAGTIDDFPAARFHLQDLEMAYATGRHMAHKPFGYAYSADHVKRMIDKLFEGRLAFPRRRFASCAGGDGAPHRRAHDGDAMRARADAARLGGARFGREPSLREHGSDGAVPHRLQRRRHGPGLRDHAPPGGVAGAYRSRPRPAGDGALPGGAGA